MTIKQVDIQLIHNLSAEEAMKVFPPLLGDRVLEYIDSFQAVAVLGQKGDPEIGEPISRAHRLQITTRDLSDIDADTMVERISTVIEKLGLERKGVVQIFPLEFQPPGRMTSE